MKKSTKYYHNSLRRVDAGDLLPGFRFDKLIVDEDARWLLVFPAVRSRKLNYEIRHGVALALMMIAAGTIG